MTKRLLSLMQGPIWALCALALLAPTFATAQQLGAPQTSVLTISSERLFSESEFGRRVFGEIEAESALLAEENERIVAQLSKEEQDLTEKRATMSAEEFSPLADAFDSKVQSHRDGQRAKLDALSKRSEEARSLFFELSQPILIGLMRDTGASLIVERSNVFLSSDATDITNLAISRINAEIGDGSELEDQPSE